jgi:hypothetical protein
MTLLKNNLDKKTVLQGIKLFLDKAFNKKKLDIISYISGWMGLFLCAMIFPREINSKIGRIIFYIFLGLYFIFLIWRGIKEFILAKKSTDKT